MPSRSRSVVEAIAGADSKPAAAMDAMTAAVRRAVVYEEGTRDTTNS